MLVRNSLTLSDALLDSNKIDELVKTDFVFFLGESNRYVESVMKDSSFTLLCTQSFQDIMLSLEGCDLIPSAIIIEERAPESIIMIQQVSQLRKSECMRKVPIILYSRELDNTVKSLAMKYCLDDYHHDASVIQLSKKIEFLNKIKHTSDPDLNNYEQVNYKWPAKRIFDVIFSGLAIGLLLPLMLLIAIAIALESRGPIFYISKRAGKGYKVFDFFKFRTMYKGSDKQLELYMQRNQYRKKNGQSTFFKVKDDPRVTKVGRFLRNTSLDELPQLINVLKGDMSIVGNRPLPLYEAKMLTNDEGAERFLAPAGLTGLWQVTKRGTDEISDEDRVNLDKIYARKHSMLFDLKLILKTFPVMIQKESV